ncbi:GGDEF domain-containing protein [Spirochaeta isovalerica]|uniref:diguanylate cyclase n=1 Tax=Spirochaeta isovalerica TaxID=150 RepID=A0A841RDM9_9SPIO|nr:diguanylate cyclase [Spirochaeta isovalerica]MBB6481736.1 diguanylate cyclase (GGDEF)-like protein [Spirochaeta isovalerica]
MAEDRPIPSGRASFNYDLQLGSPWNIARLDGVWEFYWSAFLNPDISLRKDIPDPEYITVPGSWDKETDHPAHGYGTLRLTITGLVPGKIYSLYMPELVTSYHLYINGIDQGRNGIPGTTEAESRPRFLPRLVAFYTEGEKAEILIHVSNFQYRKSGIWRSLFLGELASITKYRDFHLIVEMAIAGILFAIALFHVGIYIYRNQEKAEFLFGLICLTFLIRILCTGEQLLTFLIPSFSWEILRKLEFIPFYGSAPLLALFMSTLFPAESSRRFSRVFMGISLFYGMLVWLLPVKINNHLIPFAEGLMIIGLLYAIWIQARALKARREEAPMLTTAYILFSITVLNDILYASQLIPTMYLSPLGFVIFIFIQSQMLIRRYSRSFFQRDLLARSRDQFREASITDSLTGLYNVRYLHRVLEREIHLSPEKGAPLSLIMADVDNFKNFNDTWGHKQGDEVLKTMGSIIRGSAREHDTPCRYGGEEFSVVLPETALEEALEVAERIRFRFENGAEKDERMGGITVSLGVAQYRAPESTDDLIERADKALYRAKHQGKNQVVRAE